MAASNSRIGPLLLVLLLLQLSMLVVVVAHKKKATPFKRLQETARDGKHDDNDAEGNDVGPEDRRMRDHHHIARGE